MSRRFDNHPPLVFFFFSFLLLVIFLDQRNNGGIFVEGKDPIGKRGGARSRFDRLGVINDDAVSIERLGLLRERMKLENIDAWIVQTADAHQTSYIADRDKRREWLTGFTGGAGTALVTSNLAVLWTDSRYYEQAELQLSEHWILMKSGLKSTPSLDNWLATNLSEYSRVGVDSNIVTYNEWITWTTSLNGSNVDLITIEGNLIDAIWNDQPDYPNETLYEHPLSFAGTSREDKVESVRNTMIDSEIDVYVITALDEIAWLTNLRGAEIPNTPLFRSYVIITLDTATIYVPLSNLELVENIITNENSYFAVEDYENFFEHLTNVTDSVTKVLLPSAYSYALGVSYKVYSTVPSDKIQLATSPVLLMKDRKTDVEADGMRNAHLKDAVALCRMLAILETGIANGESYDELRVRDELTLLRKEQSYNVGNSFDTIAAYGVNSALAHYTPNEDTNLEIGTDNPFMLDSGGQYYDGTTDVTRTMHYGIPTTEHVDTYTSLLAGCIDLARLVFPLGASYATTDTILRSHLYRLGRNYGHGSTHGIGHFLSVHEAWNSTYDLNFFGSQEPGYYTEATWGMRLENIVTVVRANTTYEPEDTFLTFETVTLVPYARNLIDANKLTDDQLRWLNEYHATIRSKVGAELLVRGLNSTYDWLVENTMPITKRYQTRRGVNFVAIPSRR